MSGCVLEQGHTPSQCPFPRKGVSPGSLTPQELEVPASHVHPPNSRGRHLQGDKLGSGGAIRAIQISTRHRQVEEGASEPQDASWSFEKKDLVSPITRFARLFINSKNHPTQK